MIGAILTTGRPRPCTPGTPSPTSFLTGYRWGLIVAAILVAAGGVAAFLALRGKTPLSEAEVIAAEAELELELATV